LRVVAQPAELTQLVAAPDKLNARITEALAVLQTAE
jgi:hypothetical protein